MRILSYRNLFITVLLLLSLTDAAIGQDYRLIEPITNDGTDPDGVAIVVDLPPFPERLFFDGISDVVSGTSYTLRYSATQNPALVVAVGAEIQSLSYDSTARILTIQVLYSGKKIIANDKIDPDLLEKTFFIFIDPGATATGASSKPRAESIGIRSVDDCYGPAGAIKQYSDGPDFDPENLPDSGLDFTVGLPDSVTGSYLSTNLFFWCVKTPSAANPGLGFGFAGAGGQTGTAATYFSPTAISYLSTLAGVTLDVNNLSIFSGTFQASKDIVDVNSGIFFDIKFPLNAGSTVVTSDQAAGLTNGNAVAIQAAEASSSSSETLVEREISLKREEEISLSPNNVKVTRKRVKFTGFVADSSLVGQKVQILRFGRKKKKSSLTIDGSDTIEIQANVTVIGTATVKTDSSYQANVSSKKVFPNDAKKAKVASQVQGDTTNQSRQVTLSNKARDIRR